MKIQKVFAAKALAPGVKRASREGADSRGRGFEGHFEQKGKGQEDEQQEAVISKSAPGPDRESIGGGDGEGEARIKTPCSHRDPESEATPGNLVDIRA